MLPPVYALLAANSGVTNFVGSDPSRIYRHGNAPQRVATPYITWYTTLAPENDISDLPRIDKNTVQIDVWSEKDAEVEELAEAVRDAVEPFHHMISAGPNTRDPETMRYRITLIFTFWTDRP